MMNSESLSYPTSNDAFDLQAIYKTALKEYSGKTGIDLAAYSLATWSSECHDSPHEVIAVLCEHAERFDEFRMRDLRVMRSLKPTVRVVHALPAMFGDDRDRAFSLAEAVFSAFCVLLEEAADVNESYDALSSLVEVLGAFLKRVKVHAGVPCTPALRETAAKILVELLAVLELAITQIMQERFKTYTKKVLGEFDVEAILQRLDRLTKNEARVTLLQTLETVYYLINGLKVAMDGGNASTENIRQALGTMQRVTSDLKRPERERRQLEIQRWLSPPDPSTNYNIARKARHSETTAWLIQGDTYKTWKKKGSMLWIHGEAGSGKSILCSAIIQDIEDMQATGLAAMAYFYFSFMDTKKQNLSGMLSSVLHQLCVQSGPLYNTLSELHVETEHSFYSANDNALKQFVLDVVALPLHAPIYIILDALDECPNTGGKISSRKKVLNLVTELVGLGSSNLRICATSRPEADIQSILAPLSSFAIALQEESGHRQDITRYVSSSIESDSEMREWRKENQKLVVDTLPQKAHGVFRWIPFQLDTLRHCLPVTLRQVIDELPRTLDQTYERVLHNIDKAKVKYAHRLFQCLMVSFRPLRVEELAEIFAVDLDAEGTPTFEATWRPMDPEKAILSTCSRLVTIVDIGGSRVVQFPHLTVKEYLTSARLPDSLSHYRIFPESAHIMLAQACLGVLLQSSSYFDKGTIADFPFLEYAANYWVNHAQFKNVATRIRASMERLFDPDERHFGAWIWLNNSEPPWEDVPPLTKPHSLLHHAARYGFRDLAERLITVHSQDVNAGAPFKSPLQEASANGHLGVARLLRQHGADVNAPDDDDLSALHLASEGGHMEVVRLLLACGADLHTRSNSEGQTPLHGASQIGHLKIVQLLTEHGADIDAQNDMDATPLLIASGAGHFDVVKWLLDHGANVNTRGCMGYTPLDAASGSGRLRVARLLIERGADMDTRTDWDSTPLHSASRGGYLKTAQLLLEHGADVDARDDWDETALHHAAEGNYPAVAQLLLAHGADVNAQDSRGQTPLTAGRRNSEIVELLLMYGASQGDLDDT